jgi:methionyl aminopeptidase
MILYKTDEEVGAIRQSCTIVSLAIAEAAKHLQPGVTTEALDNVIDRFIREAGGLPAFKGYRDFPKSSCISINEEVVHGIPGNRQVANGDVVSIDVGVCFKGFYGDSAYTFAVGDVKEEHLHLMRITCEALYKGIDAAKAGNRLGDIGWAVQQHVEVHNPYSIVRDLVGHGIGRSLHEEPEVPNYGMRGKGVKLQNGLVLAIEPMVNFGKRKVHTANDGWTVYAADKSISAHFEHTIAINDQQPLVLSSFEPIEQVVLANEYLHAGVISH